MHEILELRLLIARAAAADALHWWDDDSLTDGGITLAGRIFSRRPERAAVRLALRAARSRHAAALERCPKAVHLFNLSEQFEMALDVALAFEDLGPLRIPAPVDSMDELQDRLARLGSSPSAPVALPNHGRVLQLESREPGAELEQARILASGYLAGERGRAVFPFLAPVS